MKKLLSLVLAALMLVSALPAAVFASESPSAEPELTGTVSITMNQAGKDKASMCDVLFAAQADVAVTGNLASMNIYVVNPIPAFPDAGQDGTLKDFTVTYEGQTYVAASDMERKPAMTVKGSNPIFGLQAGQQVTA